MKKLLLLLLTCSLTISVAPEAIGKTAAGRLDPSFGKGGKVTVAFPAESAGNVGVKYELPFQFDPGHNEMAAAPGGKLVVAGSTKLVRFLRNGKLDRGFGFGGTATVARPPGMNFVLAGVAVDSLGRILLAGSARPLPTSTTLDPLISSAAIMRFAADGSVDRGFGSEGLLISDLGFEPPAFGRGSQPRRRLSESAADHRRRSHQSLQLRFRRLRLHRLHRPPHRSRGPRSRLWDGRTAGNRRPRLLRPGRPRPQRHALHRRQR
jgi:uncharacterized delta-60 repeat protein